METENIVAKVENAFTAWAEAIDELDAALEALDTARADSAASGVVLEAMRAEGTLANAGKNEQERRARLTLALRTDVDYQETLAEQRAADRAMNEAQRRAERARQEISRTRAWIRFLTALVGAMPDGD
jgi:hypothetical protein